MKWDDDSRDEDPSKPPFRLFLSKLGPCVAQIYGYEGERLWLELTFDCHLTQENTDAAMEVAPDILRKALMTALDVLERGPIE